MPDSRVCLHTSMMGWNASLMYINHTLLFGSGFIATPTMWPSQPKAAVPLYYATQLGFHDLVKHLLTERPKDAHAKGGHYVTPLHTSVSAHFHYWSSISQIWTSEHADLQIWVHRSTDPQSDKNKDKNWTLVGPEVCNLLSKCVST
jgi:hypothetical protein